jgi:hypothetical protein
MDKLREPKIKYPFKTFFKRVTPNEFVYFFKDETLQCMAFILSFCKSKSYIRKTLSYLSEDAAIYINNYINECHEDFINHDITKEIEIFCEKLIKRYQDGEFSKTFRSQTSNFLSKKIIIENKIIDTLKDDVKNSSKIFEDISKNVEIYLNKKKDKETIILDEKAKLLKYLTEILKKESLQETVTKLDMEVQEYKKNYRSQLSQKELDNMSEKTMKEILVESSDYPEVN